MTVPAGGEPLGPPPGVPGCDGTATAAAAGAVRAVSGAGGERVQASVVNVANFLTLLRLVLVPFFVWLMFLNGMGWRVVALVVFAAASLTDRLDGELARRRNLITDFGKIADPIADKALTGSALVCLSVLGRLWWWVTIVILAREIGITLLRFVVIRYGVIAASRGGKLKTMLQVIGIGLYIVPGPIDPLRWAVMGAAVAVTLVTGAGYVLKAWRLWSDGRAGRAADRG